MTDETLNRIISGVLRHPAERGQFGTWLSPDSFWIARSSLGCRWLSRPFQCVSNTLNHLKDRRWLAGSDVDRSISEKATSVNSQLARRNRMRRCYVANINEIT